MNIKSKSLRYAALGSGACAALVLLVNCGGGSGSVGPSASGGAVGGGGGGGGGTPSGTGAKATGSNYSAVILEKQTGGLAAGTIVPLACIQGGTVADAHVNGCNAVHLHGTVTIAGVGSFDDTDGQACGQGKIDIVPGNSLGLSCPALATATPANAPLSVKIDDPRKFGAIMLELTDTNGTSTVKDIKENLSAGVNKLVQTGFSQYTSASLLTYCNLGANGSGVTQIQHTKTTVSLTNGEPQQYYAQCTPAATQQLEVDLASDFTSGSFYTGSGPSPAASLIPGSNVFNATVNPALSRAGGLIVANDNNGARSANAIQYPTTGTVPPIAADTSSLSPMTQSAVSDGNYLGHNGYQGISVYALAPGLAQSYDQLDGSTSTGRNILDVGNLSAIGGVHDVRAGFAAVESGTNAAQSAAVNRYYLTPPSTVSFAESQPAFFGSGDFGTADAANGFTFTNRYQFSGTSLTPVLLSLIAQTNGSNTLHTWIVNDYRLTGTSTNATWPTTYLTAADSLSGGTAPRPTAANLTQVSYQAATDSVAVRNHELDTSASLAPLDKATQVEVDYAP